jgi:hypothetical protein
MFSVDEYYRFTKTFSKTTRHLQRFSELEEAKRFATSAYQEIKVVPESEAVWLGIKDETKGQIIYTQPEDPLKP